MNATRRRAGIGVMIAIVIVALVAACQASGIRDKTGGDTAVLRLATIEGHVDDNGQNYGLSAFVDGLRTVSGGRLKVELTTDYGGNAPDAESRVVRAIASGQLDGGWPSTRAFADAGITGLEAVEAPMTITTYAAEKALVSGPVAGELLDRLNGTGMVGLGLVVGPLRRPFAAKAPLLGPGDWTGIKFRVFNSPVQAEAMRALGATPVNASFSFADQLKAGSLRGAEFDITQYDHNGFTTEAGHVTANVVLWPKVFVLALSKKRFDALTTQQQAWVHEAARRAVTASVDASYGQDAAVRTLCARDVRFAEATPDQLNGLRAKLRPVLDKLAAKPADAQLLRDIQTIASQNPGPEKVNVPASCLAATGSGSLSPIPATVSGLPDGVYRREFTQQDIDAAGGDDGSHPAGIWTIRVQRGTYEVRCRPVPGLDPGDVCGGTVADRPLEVGNLRGTGTTINFVPDAKKLSRLTGCSLQASDETFCGPDTPYRLGWAVSGDTLIFSKLPGGTPISMMMFGPWSKVA